MGLRFAARLIDAVAIGALVWILSFIGAAGVVGAAESIEDCTGIDPMTPAYQECVNEQAAAAGGIIAAFFGFLFLLFIATMLYEWLMISFVGATLGKMAVGLRVVKEATGSKPGLGGGFIRWIIPMVSALVCGIGQLLVYLSPFFDSTGKTQGWHDRAHAARWSSRSNACGGLPRCSEGRPAHRRAALARSSHPLEHREPVRPVRDLVARLRVPL